jgi:hypothetical protein
MQQRFNTRNYSIRDFEEWNERGELTLAPKFQRRDVWSDKARSYLMDTIIRGKPIPKIYMRQDINPKTRRTNREIVDGQQRLRTVLSFIKDGFRISKAHSEEYGRKYYSGLDKTTQRDILKYEFVVDLLEDMPDPDLYDVFARINTYSEKLKDQELRNAKWFGEFKSSVYLLSKEFVTFLENNEIFTPKQILRMAEAEFISELLLAIHEGIRERLKTVIDRAYEKYDDEFPNRRAHEKRFRETMDAIGGIVGSDLPQLQLRATRLFYPLFCAVFHMKFGLPKLSVSRVPIGISDYPKVKMILEGISGLVDNIEEAKKKNQDLELSSEDRRFREAYSTHWVHAEERTVLTQYICRRFAKALRS